jgi:tetratricopeptide (TPR) repeat protein
MREFTRKFPYSLVCLRLLTVKIVSTVGRVALIRCLRSLSGLRPAWYGIYWMMRIKNRRTPAWLSLAAASLLALPAMHAQDTTPPETKAPAKQTPAPAAPAPAKPAESTPAPDRSTAYFHLGMANIYEEEAVEMGRQELVGRAIEEYKLAINADPGSAQISDGLADLYFRTGRIHDAEVTARTLLKTVPSDIPAHRLLGRIYLRQLGDGSNAVSSNSPSGNVLDQAIAEFEKIVELQPKSVEDRMVLGQLYTVKHLPQKAEEQFKTAQAIEPESEEVVLNLARLYAESGDLKHAAKVIEDVPVNDRSPKMEFALGAAFDQLKQPKDAIAAYQRAADMDPSDAATLDSLAQALQNDGQLDEALKEFKQLADADPENVEPFVHISDIQRRQGKYEDALATIRKARKIDPNSLEAGYNEGLLLDVLGRFDESAQTYEKMVDLTSHANGAYTAEEKNSRSIFLERLAGVYQEQGKVDQAIATYQKMIDLGGDAALRGLEGQVETYGTAKMYDKAVDASHKAVDVATKAAAANPKDSDLAGKLLDVKLMLAGALVEAGKGDDGVNMAKSLIDNTDHDRATWLRLGQFYTQLRRWKDAEDAYTKAATLTSRKEDKTYLFFLKGALAERQKHFEPAEQLFKQALDIDPANAMTLNYYGYMLADKATRLPEALKLVRKAVDIDPMNGAYLDSLGWVYFKMGNYELAEENLRQAVGRDQSDPTVHDHLGDLYEKTGRIRLAAAQWELSLSGFAKSSTADVDPVDVAKVQKKLETARVRLAKQESAIGQPKSE